MDGWGMGAVCACDVSRQETWKISIYLLSFVDTPRKFMQ